MRGRCMLPLAAAGSQGTVQRCELRAPKPNVAFKHAKHATHQRIALVHLPSCCLYLFQEDEVKHRTDTEAAPDGQLAVKAKWASFAWEREMPPALHNISLEALKGQLVMVVGVVGSGKSSLIAALLGELHARGGTVEVLRISHAFHAWFGSC